MKKLISILLTVMLLLGALGAQGEGAQDGAVRLYPIRENGLWGYMSASGEVVIEPQFATADIFRGPGYAVVSLGNDEYNYGIIDLSGALVVEPHFIADDGFDGFFYGGRDEGSLVLMDEEGMMGFFNIPNGYFSGAVYRDVALHPSDKLIQVVTEDELMGYADRLTGEIVIPCQYQSDTTVSGCFDNGYATVQVFDEETYEELTYLIDETGATIAMPEGTQAVYGMRVDEGRVVIQSLETELFGYADLQGNIVIEPKYDQAYGFEGGAAMVYTGETESYIDANGQPVGKPAPKPEEGTTLKFDEVNDSLVSVVDQAGNVLVPASEGYSFEISYEYGYDLWFNEGYQVLVKDGKYGYLGADGQVAIPFIYDDASNFLDGLAKVSLDGKMGYINHKGEMVWQER